MSANFHIFLVFHLASTQFFSLFILSKSFPSLRIPRPHKTFSKLAENLFSRVSRNSKNNKKKKLKFCTMETFTHNFFFASRSTNFPPHSKKVSLDSLFFFLSSLEGILVRYFFFQLRQMVDFNEKAREKSTLNYLQREANLT